MARTGVLLQGYGGPATVADVRPFMCNLIGREPSDALCASIESHYEAIGGGSPLLGIAEEIASALEARLSASGRDIPVRVGMRYWEPYIADSMGDLIALGCDRVVTVSLSAFESEIAPGAYRKAIEPMLEKHPGLVIIEAPLMGATDAYAEFFARSVDVICTLEDHAVLNGFGCAVIERLADAGIKTPVVRIGWPDQFIEHGALSILRQIHGITPEAAVEKILPFVKSRKPGSAVPQSAA